LRRPAKRRASAGGTDEYADADGDRKHHERALLRLTGELRDRSAANPAAHIGETRRALEGRALTAPDSPANVAKDRHKRFGDLTSGCGRAIRAAASGLHADLAELVLDAAKVIGDRGNGRVKVPGSMLKHLLLFQSDLATVALGPSRTDRLAESPAASCLGDNPARQQTFRQLSIPRLKTGAFAQAS
jgi:hypothetical protein